MGRGHSRDAYTIDTLHVGTMVIDGIESPVHAWLVRGRDTTILVDVGMPEADLVQKRWATECLLGGPQPMIDALGREGVSPSEIDTVVLTHLHFDHAWNIDLFAGARFVLQRAELLHAVDPVPTQRGSYSRDINAKIVGMRRPSELLLIDGDHDLADGLMLVATPGHTPGQMGLIVQTTRGRAGLSSDAGEHYANWYPADPRASDHPTRALADSFMPPKMLSEAIVPTLQAMSRFRSRCDIVVPSHDPRVPRHMPDQWWELPVADTLSHDREDSPAVLEA
jgi:N-acyl homoserine lactone hydrolase